MKDMCCRLQVRAKKKCRLIWQCMTPAVYRRLPELHADLFSRHASPLEVYVLWRSTKEVKMLCLTRFVVDTTENNKEGGVAAEVCSSQTGV